MSGQGEFGYVEIPVSDIGRAADFYEAVAGWRVQRDTENSPGYWTFGAGGDDQAGALFRAETLAPHQGGPLSYFRVDDIDKTVEVVRSAGGTVERERTDIGGGHGYYAVFRDLDGNRFGLWSRS